MRSAGELAREARIAADVRALIEDPNVVALRVEKVRTWIDRLFAVAVVLGLLFTMISVQQFASQGFPTYSFTWWTAWLLDPMFSLALIAVLIAEVVTARYQVKLGRWSLVSKWFFLATVLTMNTWLSFVSGSPSGVVLHAAPVILVFVIACVAPEIRERLTDAVYRAEEASRVESGSVDAPDPVPFQTVWPLPPAVPLPPLQERSGAPPGDPPPPKVPEGLSDADLVAALRGDWLERGRRPGEDRMSRLLGVSRARVRGLLRDLPDPSQLNGSRR